MVLGLSGEGVGSRVLGFGQAGCSMHGGTHIRKICRNFRNRNEEEGTGLSWACLCLERGPAAEHCLKGCHTGVLKFYPLGYPQHAWFAYHIPPQSPIPADLWTHFGVVS